MKNLLIAILALTTVQLTASPISDFEKNSDVFFAQWVKDGKVNYAGIKNNPANLNKLVKTISTFDVAPLSDIEKQVFYINSYNLLVIHQIVKNYPVKSVMDVSGFFDGNKNLVAGEKLTLNDIENKKLREVYGDPRFHFVLVCGAVSCPPIISEAYKTSSLDAQLERQTKKAINNAEFIQTNGGDVKISEIFNWYKGDFEKDGMTVNSYLNKYRKQKIPEDQKLGYYTYNWTLNEFKALPTEEGAEKKKVNLQEYTPSVLLSKNQWEVKSFQNLYTQIGGYDKNNRYTDNGSRSTFFTSINQVTYGINRRFNVGVDLWLKSVLYASKESSPLEIFQFANSPQSRTEISTIGPRIRVNPIKKWSHFAINTSFLIPVGNDQNASDANDRAWLAQDAYIWLTQFYYDQALGKKFQLFFQLAPWWTIQKPGELAENKFELPFDFFVSYFPTKRLSLYIQQQFWPTFNVGGELDSYFLQGGIGGKFQVVPGLMELELSFTDFYYGQSAGAGQTYNLGLRFLFGGK